MSEDRFSLQGLPEPGNNLVLRHLQGLRREMQAVLERQDRTQHLVVRLDSHMEARFAQVEARLAEVRSTLSEVTSDLVLMENQLLNRHNEVLGILRRLDETIELQVKPDEPEPIL